MATALVILAAAAVSDFWRVMGALVSARLDESSQTYRLVRSVATALIGAVIARQVLYPTGLMLTVPMWLQLLALVVGFLGYRVTARSMLAGTLACECVLVTGTWLWAS